MSYTPYLTKSDYLATIQDGQLTDQILAELTNSGDKERKFAEGWAIGIIRGKLKAKFDLDFEFTETLPYDPTKVYYAGSRVVIDYADWEAKKYEINSCVIKDGIGYICIVNESANTFDEAEWQPLGNQYTIYYIKLPFPLFSLEIQTSKGVYTAGFYNVDDNVWWLNHTYSALRKTVIYDHATIIQYRDLNDLPPVNIFPNDPQSGAAWWKDLGEYSIKAYIEDETTLPVGTDDNPSVWTVGDNRDPVTMQAVIDLAIWMLHKRIAPQNIPKLREQAKNDIFSWIASVKSGDTDTDLIQLQPSQGDSFAWGSNPKLINQY